MLNDKVKTLLTILGLLLIGFLIGFQTNRYLMKQHFKKVAESRVSPKLKNHLIQRLELSEEQKVNVEPIIKRYTERLTKVSREAMNQRKSIVDSMRSEISPLLNETQLEELERFASRMKRMRKKRMKKEKKADSN